MRSFATILTALSLPLYAFSAHHGEHIRRHADLAVRARGDLAKRYDGVRFTYYDITTGQVACGGNYQPNDYVVALNSAQYGNKEHCFQYITISYSGITLTAQIVDECPGCPYGGLDLTQGLFVALAGSTDKGVLTGSWDFSSGSPPEENPTTTTPKHTTTPKYTPTPEYTPPPTTTTQQAYTPHSSPRTTSTSTSTPPPPPPSSSTSTSKTSLSALATSPSSVYNPDLSTTSTATSTSSVSFSIATPGPLAQPAAGAITNAGIPRTNPCSISYTQCYLTIITLLYLHACYI